MLTAGLEKAIQKGLAQERTAVVGAGGVYRIPVAKGSFIIIHHFDYFHFIDPPTPSIVGAPASSIVIFDKVGIFTATWTIPGGLCGIPPLITFDSANILLSQTNFQAMLNTCFPGFTVGIVFAGTQWTITVTTTSPGVSFNGTTPVFNVVAGLVIVTTFSGGTASITILADVLSNATHQLNFRSTKSRNHYVIQEDFTIFSLAPIALGRPFYYNVNGVYKKDCYLVHTEDVQINILKVPPPHTWTTIYGAVSEKSQEFATPEGYGISAGGLNTVNEVLFAPGEAYKPLTPEFTTGGLATGQPEFKVNAVLGRQLSNPAVPVSGLNNGRTYPLINVDYVLINKDYNDFVKQS